MNFVVVSYYTENTLYEEQMKTLEKSLLRHHIPFRIKRIKSLGRWEDNVNHKPTFLKAMLKHYGKTKRDIVWTDCDAMFQSYPVLFDCTGWDFAVPIWRRNRSREEILSGTIYLRNCSHTRAILDAWEKECMENPDVWDQRSLAKVLTKYEFSEMPLEYCKIFDKMSEIEEPVIVHHQASRQVRKNNGRLSA